MNPLVVIIAHGKATPVFRRHLPLWESHGFPILVCTPQDDTVETEHEKVAYGPSEGAGECAHLRLSSLMLNLANRNNSHFVVFEYDSFFTERKIDFRRGFHGIMFANLESPKFMAPRYAGFPWIIDGGCLFQMIQAYGDFPNLKERGHNDRWLAALASISNVPMFDFDPPGFSRGKIKDEDFNDLKKAIDSGVKSFHGVKDQWVFDYIIERSGIQL